MRNFALANGGLGGRMGEIRRVVTPPPPRLRDKDDPLRIWSETAAELARVERLQLFFVGGAPRSGTTWLQQMLDCHPEVSCRGEGLFWKDLAVPMERLMAQRGEALEAKNKSLFTHTGGYPLPAPADAEFLIGTAVLLALRRQSETKPCLAVGEKTPENVFFFPRLKQLFPHAKFVAIARDPRDVLTSAWHFFGKRAAGADEATSKMEFIRGALPSLADGARTMIAFSQHHLSDYALVTYEGLRRTPEELLGRLFRFLGVSDSDGIVRDCLERTSFSVLAGGRPAGVEQNGSFFRKGAVGDWATTLTPEMNDLVLRELGWMFPHFGWRP